MNGLVVFPTFFSLSLNFATGVDLSHSQLQVLFLLTIQNFSIFICKEHNQSDFGIDHLVMSMCRVISCVLEEGICYDQCVCQLLPCFILYSKAKLACYSPHMVTSYFCIPITYDENDISFWCQFKKILQVFIKPVNYSFFSISLWDMDLGYSDVEWFALVMN